MSAAVDFKRFVLGLQSRAHGHDLLLAVELANLLQLDLLGLFLQDSDLDKLVNLPFAREFRTLGGGWQPIAINRLVQDLELAAGRTERLLMEAAARHSKSCRFEIKRGPTAETIAAISQSTDIVAIFEPPSMAERSTRQFLSLVDAAFQSAAAVMLVPSRIVRQAGPIAALAMRPDDPSVPAAARIASVMNEDLIVLHEGTAGPVEAAVRAAAPSRQGTVRMVRLDPASPSDLAPLVRGYRQLGERLIVMTRGVVENSAAIAIASGRRVPVLVVEPPRADRAAAAPGDTG